MPAREVLDAAWPGWAAAGLVIAADGGARHAVPLGLRVGSWVGDGDSIDGDELRRLERAGVQVERVPADKDETDTELAVSRAVAAGARTIAILGATGGARLDHAVANLALLASRALAGLDVTIYDHHGSRVTLVTAPGPDGGAVQRAFHGRAGDLVSLVPLDGDAVGLTSTGLRYPLVDGVLELGRARGVSNVRTRPEASVTLRSGRLLVIETPVTVGP